MIRRYSRRLFQQYRSKCEELEPSISGLLLLSKADVRAGVPVGRARAKTGREQAQSECVEFAVGALSKRASPARVPDSATTPPPEISPRALPTDSAAPYTLM